MIRREKRTEEVERTVYVMNQRVKFFFMLIGVMVGIPIILLSLAFTIPVYLEALGYVSFGLGFLATYTEGES